MLNHFVAPSYIIKDEEGTFRWINGDKPELAWLNETFEESEPNGGTKENCVVSNEVGFEWYDITCEFRSSTFGLATRYYGVPLCQLNHTGKLQKTRSKDLKIVQLLSQS